MLIKKGSLTWSELLQTTKLSRPGLSKILKSLTSRGIVGHDVKEYKGKWRVAYKSKVKSLIEAETTLFYSGFVDILKEARTYKEVKECLEEDLPSLLYYIFTTYLYEALTSKDAKKPVNALSKDIKTLFRVIADGILQDDKIRRKVLNYYRKEYEELRLLD